MAKREAGYRNFPIWKQRLLLCAAVLAFASPRLRAAPLDLDTVRARADRGDADALNALGNAYANGQGVPQNFAEAIRLYRQAAERGVAAANFNLGMLYELGRGVAADPSEGFKYYLKAAQQGFAPAQFNVGNMYANGVGVKQDFFEAALWFRQAADRGIPEAQYNLALAYELGRGVTKDETTAQKWYREAANQGYARARYNLALMLEEGRGAPADPAAAAQLYRAAALQNFPPAQNNLGILLAEGRGAPQNIVEAFAWLSLAVENGAKPTGRDIVAQQLNSTQNAEAKAVIAQLRSQIAGANAAAVAVASTPPPAAPGSGADLSDAGALRARVSAVEEEVEKLRAENARLNTATRDLTQQKNALEQRLASAAAAAQSATSETAAREQQAAELARLQKALADAQAANERLTSENARLHVVADHPTPAESNTIAMLQSQVEQLTREKQAAGSSSAGGPAAAPTTASPATASIPLPALAKADPRIATLLAENARLNDEVKRSTIQLAQMARPSRVTSDQAEGRDAVADAGAAAVTRQLEAFRIANEKLLADNQRLQAASADAARLRQENESLRAAAAAKTKDQVSPADKAALEKRIADLTAQSAAAVTQLEEFRHQMGDTANDLGQSRRTIEDLRTQLADAKAALAQQHADNVAGSKDKISTAEQAAVQARAERDQLARQLAELQGKPAADDKRAGLEQQLKDQQAYADKLEQANGRLNEQITALTAERDRLAAEAKQPSTGPSTPAADRAALTQQVAELTQRLADQKTISQTLEASNAKLSDQLTTLKADRDQLSATLQQKGSAAASAAKIQQEASAAAKERDALAGERAALAQRVEELGKRLATGEAEMQQLKAANAKLTADLAAANADKDKLNTASQAGLSAQAQLVQTQQALADATKKGDGLSASNAELERRLAELNKQLAAVSADRDRLAQATSDTVVDRQTLDKLTAQLDAAGKTIADLNSKNDNLRQDLEVAKQSAAAALAAQAAAVKAAPTDAMKLEMQTLQDQVRTLETQLDNERKNSAQELSAIAAQLQSARESNRALSDANRSLMQVKGSDDAAVKATIDGLKSQLASAQAEIEKTHAAQAATAADLEARRRELVEAQNAATAPAQERDALKAQLDQTVTRLKSAEQTIADLKQAADAASATAAKLRNDNAALQARFGDASKAADQQGATVAELTGLNEKLSADKAALEKQLAELKQSSEISRADLTELKRRVTAGDKVAQDQLANINDLTASNEKLEQQVKELGDKLAGLQADNTRLAASAQSADAARTELATLKAQLADAQKVGDQQGATVAEITGANEKLTNDVKALQAQLAGLRADNARLAQSEQARQDAEQRAASLANAAAQLAASQRELAGARAEIARLNDTVQALDRDRSTRVTQLQQENAAIAARLRQAQGTLDQIASAARVLNGGAAPAAAPAPAPAATTAIPTIVTTASPAAAPAGRVHVVAEGDSLTRISLRYYGTSTRWQDIYDANRDLLRGENALRPGQRLRIP